MTSPMICIRRYEDFYDQETINVCRVSLMKQTTLQLHTQYTQLCSHPGDVMLKNSVGVLNVTIWREFIPPISPLS